MEILLREAIPLLKGALATVEMLFGLLALGLLMGLLFALVQVYGRPVFRLGVSVVELTLRGVPALVLLMLVFFGVLKFEVPFIAIAIVTLGVRSSAYQSQIFKGAIESVESSQMEAAKAIGLTKVQAILHIILPQAIRFSIGPWTNEYSTETKLVSLAYVVGVIDILRQARYIIQYTYGNELVLYSVIAVFYFILNRIGTAALYALEDKLYVPGFKRRGT